MSIRASVQSEIDRRREEFLNTLFRLVCQPSISTQGLGVEECAELLKTLLEEHGISGRILPTDGLPVVYGERLVGDDANTILIYGHYDVQPPEPYEAWVSPPFEPTIRDGRIYARGVGDNKGQHLASILAVKLLADLGELPRVNLKFILEGEEENSSPNLPGFIHRHKELLKADMMYAADGAAHISGRPMVSFGHRGNLKMELVATGPNRDVHSGNYGGPIPNPLWKLVNLFSTLRFPDGRVKIEGFYEKVVPPTDYEQEWMSKIPFDAEVFKKDLGITEFDGPPDASYWEKVMCLPTLSITGIAGGYYGKGAKSAIPSQAVAKLEVRQVVDMNPEDTFAKIQRHVQRYAPDITIRKIAATAPTKTSLDLPVSRMVIKTIGDAYGVEPVVRPTSGGSSPDYLFTNVLNLPTIWATYGPYDENQHSPNENMTLESFFNGIRASALLIQRFAAMPRSDLGRGPKG